MLGVSGVMDIPADDFADRIYLAIELECDGCQTRFAEPDADIGGTEADVRRWADKTAAAARLAGWRIVTDRILCPDCIAKHL
jgi:hypothetical protein